MDYLIVFHNKIPGEVETYAISGERNKRSGTGQPPLHVPMIKELPLVVIEQRDVAEKANDVVLKHIKPILHPESLPELLKELEEVGCNIS